MKVGGIFVHKAARQWLKKWGVRLQSSQAARRRGGKTRTRLGVEWLEDRTVPSLVYTPGLGAETELRDNGAREGGNPVYLIFTGSDWGGSASSAHAQEFEQAACNLLTSPYLNGLQQYNVGIGGAHIAGAVWDPDMLSDGPRQSTAPTRWLGKPCRSPSRPVGGSCARPPRWRLVGEVPAG